MDWQLIFGAISAAALVTIAIVSAFGLKSVVGFYRAQSTAQEAQISLLEKQRAPAVVAELTSVSQFADQLQEELRKVKTRQQTEKDGSLSSRRQSMRTGMMIIAYEAAQMAQEEPQNIETARELFRLSDAIRNNERVDLPHTSKALARRAPHEGYSTAEAVRAFEQFIRPVEKQESETPPASSP